jgi:hypothetical protein
MSEDLWFQFITTTLFGMLEVYAQLSITFLLFRINIFAYLKETIWISLISAILSTLFYNVFEPIFSLHIHSGYYEGFTLIIRTLLITWVLKLHIGYSFLMDIAGYIIKDLLLVGVIILSFHAGFIPSVESPMYELAATITVQFLLFVLVVPLARYLYQQGVGFLILANKFDFKSEYKKCNIIITMTLWGTFTIFHISVHYFLETHELAYKLIVVGIFLYLTFWWIFYFRSQKELRNQMNKLNLNNFFK